MRNTAFSQIWAAMRKSESFTAIEIAETTGKNPTTVRKYLKALDSLKFVEFVSKRVNGIKSSDRYRVIRTDVTLPDLKGNEIPENDNDKMWGCMRICRIFKIQDIAATAAVEYGTASRFVSRLQLAGYLQMTKSNLSGSRGSFAVYQLVRNTGVRCPVIQADGRVYDCNNNQFFGVDRNETKY